jgi:hypothetical protein
MSYIKDFFPKSGSLFGGSIITIIGYRFPRKFDYTLDKRLKITIGNRLCLPIQILEVKVTCTIEQISPHLDPYDYQTLIAN